MINNTPNSNEYQVLALARGGRVIGVQQHPSLSAARAAVPTINDEIRGWVIEHVTCGRIQQMGEAHKVIKQEVES